MARTKAGSNRTIAPITIHISSRAHFSDAAWKPSDDPPELKEIAEYSSSSWIEREMGHFSRICGGVRRPNDMWALQAARHPRRDS
jgi:hypothetical protein